MNDKKNQWLLVWIDKTHLEKRTFLNSREDVHGKIKEIIKAGSDISCVRVYPPNSNLTATEFLLYE